jgi:hypothetical protein
MENVIFKYSDFFQDDGGFDKIRSDFDKLGDDLVKKAKEIKNNVKLFDIEDVEAVKDFETETEALMKMFKKYGDAKDEVAKIEKAYLDLKKKESQSNDEQIDQLVSLDKQLQKYRDDLAEITTLSKLGIKTDRDLNKERVEAELNIKKVNKEIQKQQQEIIKSTELSKKEQKLLQAKITLEKTEIKTLDDVRERMSALRVVVQSMDYREQADEIRAYNDEINQLTEVLSENSDKFIQSKINVGNYEESIVNALKGTQFFRGELGALNGIVENLIGTLWASTKATEANTEATEANTVATTRMGKAIKALNTVAKATGILLLITAIASLASVFAQGRAGVIATERAMARFSVVAKVAINLLAEVGKGIFYIFMGIGTSIGNMFDNMKLFAMETKLVFQELTGFSSSAKKEIDQTKQEIANLKKELASKKESDNYAKGWDKIKTAFGSFREQYENGMKAIKTADKGIIEAFKIGDRIKQAELNLIGLRKQVRLLEIASEDSTRSLTSQLESTDMLLNKRLKLLREEANIERLNLKMANAKARVDAEIAGYRLSQDDVQFAKELLALNQSLDPTNNPLDDALLEESVNALKKYLEALNEIDIAQAENAKQRREIQRDLFEQNLDLLIDLIDTEKNLSEQYVNDISKSFENRVNEFNRFLMVFRSNAQKVLNEFTKEAKAMDLNLDFQIQFDDNGDFEIFINDQKLAVDNIVELNKQLQSTGMNEIEINRFREFIVETRNGVRDFRDLNKELKLVGINVRELKANLEVTQDELKSLDELQAKIDQLKDREMKAMTTKERNAITGEIEKLEKEKTHIAELGEIFRKQNRKKAIDEELKLVEEGSQRYYELMQERLDIDKELQNEGLDKALERTKEANQKALDEYKKWADEVRAILDAILDKVIEVNQKRVESAQQQVEKQGQLVDEQKRRAEQGLTNTLAFEQRELGKREAELIKRQKRQERLEKIKALYSSYNNYASQGDQNPILKALRDFAILEAISASFGDGGIVEDRLPSDGIFRGQSHNGNRGGIPILVEGREGIFSAQEMENLGKDNFYKLKDLASMGKMDSNFFSKQRKQFVQTVVAPAVDPTLVREMREVKKAIESKPVQSWDVAKVANGVMDLVEETVVKNGKKRNHHIIKKPRL